jgi:hypothetical protein
MRSIFIFSFFYSINVFSQEFNQLYFGEDVYLYQNALLKIDTGHYGGYNYMFYNDLENCKIAYNEKVIYPEEKYPSSTDPRKLENRIFKVDKILNKDGIELTGKANRINVPILVLRDTLNQEIIYFRYDTKYATSTYGFPFLTSVQLGDEYFCDKIQILKDDFTGEITTQTPLDLYSKEYFYKISNGTDTFYYLGLESNGSTVTIDGKGVIILFEDGTKFEKLAEEIDVKVGKTDYIYSCFISLTKDEAKLFASKKISKYRLYIYDTIEDKFASERFMKYVKCILNK